MDLPKKDRPSYDPGLSSGWSLSPDAYNITLNAHNTQFSGVVSTKYSTEFGEHCAEIHTMSIQCAHPG